MEKSYRFGPDAQCSLQVLWEDGERVFCRGWRRAPTASGRAVLAVLPAAEHPTPRASIALPTNTSLKDELDGAWAVRPLELVRERRSDHAGARGSRRRAARPAARRADGDRDSFLRLAIGIAAALGKVAPARPHPQGHQAGQYPGEPRDRQVRLTGFGIASRLPRERQSPEPPESIAGTLAYMAPEQTGRMNRSIDSRSDLYALGVTLYQMLTGALPFTASDPMEWVHCHIARQPVPPPSG